MTLSGTGVSYLQPSYILYIFSPTVPLETAIITYQIYCSPHRVALLRIVLVDFIVRW